MSPELHTLTSRCGRYTRRVWWLPSLAPEVPHPLYLFLDGEVYFQEMKIAPVIRSLMKKGRIAAGACLFLSCGRPEDRLGDFACNDAYGRFVAEDVITWAQAHDGALQEGGHTIAGVSLSGLAAACLTLRYPRAFARALCQSGSFWWLKERDVVLPSTATARFWLSVGKKETATHIPHPGVFQEISQIEGVEWAAARIRSLGGTVEFRYFPGKHAATAWRNDVAPGLEWLSRTDESR